MYRKTCVVILMILVVLATIFFCTFTFYKERDNNQKIYDSGYVAGQADITPSACPYSWGTKREYWMSGWTQAYFDKKKSNKE